MARTPPQFLRSNSISERHIGVDGVRRSGHSVHSIRSIRKILTPCNFRTWLSCQLQQPVSIQQANGIGSEKALYVQPPKVSPRRLLVLPSQRSQRRSSTRTFAGATEAACLVVDRSGTLGQRGSDAHLANAILDGLCSDFRIRLSCLRPSLAREFCR